MRHFRFGGLGPALIAVAIAVQAAPAAAQYTSADPATTLSQSLKQLSTSPKELNALMAAGRASLDMGDVQAAAGFFGRAEDAYPSSPLPKVGMGAALALTGDVPGAMSQFERATALGAPQSMVGLDRGLAYDLQGQQAKAQADYRAATFGTQADEARRRLALSLAISGDFKGAAATLAPMLNRGDQSALRTNAFVLALAGDPVAARRTIDAAMPGQGAGLRFEPFFKMLPILRPDEKAAAVHLGEFPQDAAQRYALAQSVPASPTMTLGRKAIVPVDTTKVKVTPPPSSKRRDVARVKVSQPAPRQVATGARPADSDRKPPQVATRGLRGIDRLGNPIYGRVKAAAKPAQQSARRETSTAASQPSTAKESTDPEPEPALAPSPAFSLPSEARTEPAASLTSGTPAEAEPATIVAVRPTDDLLPLPDEQEPVTVREARLNADGEPLLPSNDSSAAIDTVPPPPAPKVERSVSAKPKPKIEAPSKAKLAADKKAKEAADKALAEKKAKEKEKQAAAKLGASGTFWVQLAGGQNAERMGSEYKRISGKQPSLFRGRTPYVTAGKDYFRLLIGPFKTAGEAHDYVSKLDKAGIDSFMWTRSPAQIRIDKIASK